MSEFIREATPPVGCSSRNSYAGLDPSNQVETYVILFCFFSIPDGGLRSSPVRNSHLVFILLINNFLIIY